MNILTILIISVIGTFFLMFMAIQAVTYTNKHILISSIKNNPQQADEIITQATESIARGELYCTLDDNFYKKYASPTLYITYKFEREFYKILQDSDESDVIANEKLNELQSQFLGIKQHLQKRDDMAKLQVQREQLRTLEKEQQNKLELLTNKASQVLDDVWD